MVVDLSSLRGGPENYLGWRIEGNAEPLSRYVWYAWEQKDDPQGFSVKVNGRRLAGDHAEQFTKAKELGLAIARGKIFLDSWSNDVEYLIDDLPTAKQVSTQEIREAILLGLFRLHESDLPSETPIDLDGVCAEMGTTETLVHRAVKYLHEHGLIEDYGTFGRNWSTGDFWISTSGISYLEDRGIVPGGGGSYRESTMSENRAMASDPARVAVVHGRDEPLRQDLFNFLRALGLNPVEWSTAIKETRRAAPYVGEVIDALFQNVRAVVVLWTGDDIAQLRWSLKQSPSDAQRRYQPRPNVILEAGMALSKMPERVVLFQVGEVGEISDLTGRYVVRSSDANWRNDLANRLETAGCPIGKTGVDWLTVGEFRLPSDDEPNEETISTPPRDDTASAVERLQGQSVNLFGTELTIAEFFKRIGGELAGTYDDRYTNTLMNALEIEPPAGEAYPFGEITKALNVLLAEGLITRQTLEHKSNARSPLSANTYRTFTYTLVDPKGRDVLLTIRNV